MPVSIGRREAGKVRFITPGITRWHYSRATFRSQVPPEIKCSHKRGLNSGVGWGETGETGETSSTAGGSCATMGKRGKREIRDEAVATTKKGGMVDPRWSARQASAA